MDRGPDKSAQACREIFGMLTYTLDVTVNGGASLEMRLNGVGLVLNEET